MLVNINITYLLLKLKEGTLNITSIVISINKHLKQWPMDFNI
jgi:hypothetical protein